MNPLIAVVDYGMGNLRSVANALAYVGCRFLITSEPGGLDGVDGVIVPGVGAFPDAMKRLERLGLATALLRYVETDRPLLGICLGMQILFEYGEEGGGAAGLGLIPGRVVRLGGPEAEGLKVPHMGWDTVEWAGDDEGHTASLAGYGGECGGDPRRAKPRGGEVFPLFQGLRPPQYFYFVHSYCVPLPLAGPSSSPRGALGQAGSARAPEAAGVRVAWCSYGMRFVAAVQKGNIMGTQFHPEKSGRVGLSVVRNFAALCGTQDRGQGDAGLGKGGAAR